MIINYLMIESNKIVFRVIHVSVLWVEHTFYWIALATLQSYRRCLWPCGTQLLQACRNFAAIICCKKIIRMQILFWHKVCCKFAANYSGSFLVQCAANFWHNSGTMRLASITVAFNTSFFHENFHHSIINVSISSE